MPSVFLFLTVLVGEGLGLKDIAERSLLCPGSSSSKFSILKFLGSLVRCTMISPDVNAKVLTFLAFLCCVCVLLDSCYTFFCCALAVVSSVSSSFSGDCYSIALSTSSTCSISRGFGSLTTSKVLLMIGLLLLPTPVVVVLVVRFFIGDELCCCAL